MSWPPPSWLAAGLLLVTACAGERSPAGPPLVPRGPASRSADEATTDRRASQRSAAPVKLDGSLPRYIDRALATHPDLKAAHADWSAARAREGATGTLPDPTLSYTFFARPIETRTGPQRHKVGVEQRVPWPTALSAESHASRDRTLAERRRYEAAGLMLIARVQRAYWTIWTQRRLHQVTTAIDTLLEQLAASTRARLEVGKATLADLGQIDLQRSRLVDDLGALKEQERQARSRLAALVGGRDPASLPIADAAPEIRPLAESDHTLAKAAADHPRVRAFAHLADAEQSSADQATAAGYPSFTVGAEYIVVDDARMPGVSDSGADPIALMLGVSLPIWRGAYAARSEEAKARSVGFRARLESQRRQAKQDVAIACSRVRDARRRVTILEGTLVPQAESVLGSVVGAYQVDRATLAALLLAYRDLVDLQLRLVRARADHAIALADLEAAVGRPVQMKGAP